MGKEHGGVGYDGASAGTVALVQARQHGVDAARNGKVGIGLGQAQRGATVMSWPLA